MWTEPNPAHDFLLKDCDDFFVTIVSKIFPHGTSMERFHGSDNVIRCKPSLQDTAHRVWACANKCMCLNEAEKKMQFSLKAFSCKAFYYPVISWMESCSNKVYSTHSCRWVSLLLCLQFGLCSIYSVIFPCLSLFFPYLSSRVSLIASSLSLQLAPRVRDMRSSSERRIKKQISRLMM